jgi:4-hydroxybenzoate polyprenyltransferase
MPDARFLFKVSRPRFWLYIFGPYIVGLAAAAFASEDLYRPAVLLFALYFLFPANLLVYGINDIFDYETDRLNPKKTEYEQLVSPPAHRWLYIAILVLNLPFVVAAYFLAPQALPSLAAFVFLSVFYSAPPIRAKAIPILDSFFNFLYVLPAAFAYQMVTDSFPPITIMIAGGLWTAAMHAFSALPDIGSDRKAGLSTIATLLDRSGTLLFCMAAYMLSAILAFPHLGRIGIFAGLIYCGIMLFALTNEESEKLFRIYRIFPLINSLVGFALFWYAAIPKVL